MAIKTNTHLTSLDISNNRLVKFQLPGGFNGPDSNDEFFCLGLHYHRKTPPQGAIPYLGGINAIITAIPSIQKLTSVNILSNYIGTDQAKQLIDIKRKNPRLTTLCGFSGNETELDLSNKNLHAGCALLIANELNNNGALTSLNLSNNNLGELVLPKGWEKGGNLRMNKVMYIHSDGRKQEEHPGEPYGIIAITNAIPTMTALTRLDIRNNCIPSSQKKAISDECRKKNCDLNLFLKGLETEIDMSGQNLDSVDAQLFVDELNYNSTAENTAHSFGNICDKYIQIETLAYGYPNRQEIDTTSIIQKTREDIWLSICSWAFKAAEQYYHQNDYVNMLQYAKIYNRYFYERYLTSKSLTDHKHVYQEYINAGLKLAKWKEAAEMERSCRNTN